MDKYIYLDVEYANSRTKSLCQIGILCESPNSRQVYPSVDLYVNPEDEFDSICTGIHGITYERVESAPNFAEIWADIEEYFTNSIIVGHNILTSGIDALVNNLRRYNIDIPELYYIDTLRLATEYVRPQDVENYTLDSLCSYFEIKNTNKNDAFSDAYASARLFKALVKTYCIDVSSIVRKYVPYENSSLSDYISTSALRKKITELYGVLRGFSIDNEISQREADYLVQWKEENAKYIDQEVIRLIISAIDDILDDGIVTLREVIRLQRMIKEYLDAESTSPITLATQILNGIMKGISEDREITADECDKLRIWLYDNIYLSGHFAFNRMLETLDTVLRDGIVTKEESEEIMKVIDELLNPIE